VKNNLKTCWENITKRVLNYEHEKRQIWKNYENTDSPKDILVRKDRT
jgi:hypothetical protein